MPKRIFYPLFLLFIPLIGMMFTDEINWTLSDFIIMGFLLLGFGMGIDLISTRTKNSKFRILYILIVCVLFLLIWAELAVGIFGTPFAGS
jgi:hypothetical protein